MSYRPYSSKMAVSLANARVHLGIALHDARAAECPQLVKKIKSALKSHEGAMRHMSHRRFHAENPPKLRFVRVGERLRKGDYGRMSDGSFLIIGRSLVGTLIQRAHTFKTPRKGGRS